MRDNKRHAATIKNMSQKYTYELLGEPIHANIPQTQNTDHRTTNWRYQPPLRTRKYNRHPPVQPIASPSPRSVRSTSGQLHSLQQIPRQHGKQNCPQLCVIPLSLIIRCSNNYFDIILMKYNLFTDTLPQHPVYKNEPNREYVITLARKDETL